MIGSLNRVIVFVADMAACATFYRDVLGLPQHGHVDAGWMSFDAGGCLVSLHQAAWPAGERPPKRIQIVFKVGDVAAAREALIGRGAAMGPLIEPQPGFSFCDGQDPEGNAFQIASR